MAGTFILGETKVRLVPISTFRRKAEMPLLAL